MAHHGNHVSGLVLEATRLSGSVGFLAGKAFLVYISNVYDNLPSDEVAVIRGRIYLVQTRSYLPGAAADEIAARFGLKRAEIAQLTERLLRIGPELLAESLPEKFPDTGQAVLFWQAVWQALRQAERYVPLEGLDTYRITPAVTGEILRPLLAAEGDVRMHVSNGALSSFADTLPLLHPFGRMVCHDLFTTTARRLPGRVLRPGQVRRVRRQLGQRPAAAADRQPPRLRRAVLAVHAAARVQRQDADGPGQGLSAMTADRAQPRTCPLPLLPTTVVGSY